MLLNGRVEIFTAFEGGVLKFNTNSNKSNIIVPGLNMTFGSDCAWSCKTFNFIKYLKRLFKLKFCRKCIGKLLFEICLWKIFEMYSERSLCEIFLKRIADKEVLKGVMGVRKSLTGF